MASRTLITERGMQARPTSADQWTHEPFERGAGVFASRITPAGERFFYFRYAGSSGQRRYLKLGTWHFAQSTCEPMQVEGNVLPLVGQVLRERPFLWSGEPRELATDRDVGRLPTIWLDVKVFGLQSHELHVTGQEYVSDRVDDGGLSRVVFTYERRYSFVKFHIEDRLGGTELTKVLDPEF